MNIRFCNEPVASRTQEIIAEKGLKQSAVATKAGYTAQAFSDMLNGRKIIKAYDVPAIAFALGVECNELFEAVEKVNPPDKAG